MTHRRAFLQTIAGGAFASLTTAAGGAMRLGYDAYSIRNFRWKAPKHIEYAGSLKLDALQMSLGEFESFEPGYLAQVKAAADRANIALEGDCGCICPTAAGFSKAEGTAEQRLLKGLRTTRALGGKAMRCFLGSMTERRFAVGKLPLDAHIEATLKVFKNVRNEALDTGVKIALENHNGDLCAREVREMVVTAGKDLVGVTLDTGNPMWMLEDPMETLEILAPHVVTSHFRDSAIWEGDGGIYFQWVSLGDGNVNIAAVAKRFHELCPQAPMQLEIITGRPPTLLPCYTGGETFWQAYPKVNGQQFARFAALAKRGRPFTGSMLTAAAGNKVPAEYDAAITMQQKVDLERSLAYAKAKMLVQ